MNRIPNKLTRSLVGLYLLATSVLAMAGTNTYPNTRQVLMQSIPAAMKQFQVTGLSLALVDDQTLVWAQGFGFADQKRHLYANARTLYRVGSISKLFTATAAMQFAEQGTLDIDQPLSSYLPQFAIKTRFADSAAITTRQLMTHHSGLPSDYAKGAETTTPPVSFTELSSILVNEYTAYPPHLLLSYSNIGFSLIGAAVENVCGTSFATCLSQSLLRPLGMVDSVFSAGPLRSPLMSAAYKDGQLVVEPYLRDIPAGGLNSSVMDLSRFIRMVFADGRPILKPETLLEMLRPQNQDVPLDLDDRIGLAWFLGNLPTGETYAWHDGGTGHFYSILALLPEQKLGCIVLSNSDGGQQVIYSLAQTALQLMLAEKTPNPGLRTTTPQLSKTAIPPQAEADSFAGYYASSSGLMLISNDAGQLTLNVGGAIYQLHPAADGGYVVQLPSLDTVVLNRQRLSNREVLIANTAFKRILLGEKIRQPTLSEQWLQRAGTYQVINNDANDALGIDRFRIEMVDGFLMIHDDAAGVGDRILLPVTDDQAIFAGLGRYLGETVTFETQEGIHLVKYSGLVARQQ